MHWFIFYLIGVILAKSLVTAIQMAEDKDHTKESYIAFVIFGWLSWITVAVIIFNSIVHLIDKCLRKGHS